ncbi:agamous-like MADS-box protein AGL80 [Quillaja saponaria]|uniref:Agamous-like MADS-box protein AGL80 n=1 Tax=Quillaja saponaria TaxID=32244 RepID=A0AAD7L352_QUISA|nr:agamous-like MADS-box protein AGL80 [Quillaja saponaria]
MAKKKAKLAYITNDAIRKATFKKRKKSLLNKVKELSTLCGIQACAILYSTYQREPEVSPSPFDVQRTIFAFKKKSKIDQTKNMVNQESYLRQRITKAMEQVKKQKRENCNKEIEEVMYQCLVGDQGLQKLSLAELNQLGWIVDKNIKEIGDKMNLSTTTTPKSSLTISNDDSQAKLLGWSITPKEQAYDDHEMAKNNMEMENQQWIMDTLRPSDPNIMNFGTNLDHELLPPSPPTIAFNNDNNVWLNFPFPN